MISLSDHQLKCVIQAAADIPPEKRSTFLERIGAMLAVRGRGHFNDDDVAEVAQLALTGLVPSGSRNRPGATAPKPGLGVFLVD